jgi:2-keto-4-pentenoate hydratase/2-oxohepta-3-ene-1,7-dioic acid hydratase in catechol pathway
VLRPTKIIGVGLNYRAHAEEMKKPLPEEPLIFLKPPSALIGTDDPIVRPRGNWREIHYEGELAVVIGKRARRVTRDRAFEVIAGFTCMNDVTVRELQRKDVQYTRAKGFDSFAPAGPRVVAGLDPSNLRIETRLNGQVRQQSTTADMIFDVPAILVFVSRVMTLEEGDIITTGTPPGVGPLFAGDIVEVEIEGIGVLRNPVIEEPEGAS